MKIRRIQYNIDYAHILTFKDEYKLAVTPYFAFDNVQYAVENEGSMNEFIRLIFRTEKFALLIRKEGITIIFEGDIQDLKNQNGVIKIFWDIYEKIKTFKGYTKSTRHSIIANAVDISSKEKVDSILEVAPYFKINPFGKLDEFACVYEFKRDEIKFKFHFGNYSERDIKIHDLMPFKTDFNKDLIDNFGLMLRIEAIKLERDPSFTRFKSLIAIIEKNISSFNLPQE